MSGNNICVKFVEVSHKLSWFLCNLLTVYKIPYFTILRVCNNTEYPSIICVHKDSTFWITSLLLFMQCSILISYLNILFPVHSHQREKGSGEIIFDDVKKILTLFLVHTSLLRTFSKGVNKGFSDNFGKWVWLELTQVTMYRL